MSRPSLSLPNRPTRSPEATGLARVCVAISLAALCAACSTPPTRQEIGIVSGAVVGGVVGSVLTGGSTAGTAAGAAGGALVGRQLTSSPAPSNTTNGTKKP